MVKKTILFTRPAYDIPTACLHYFSENLIEEIGNIGEYTVINLEKEKATKEQFEKAVKKSKPRLVILNGHGSKKAVYGHDNKVILDRSNINLLGSKIAYAVACDSSEELGNLAIDEGEADAYIGYDSYFMVVIDPSRSSTPSKDKNLKVFIKPYSALITSLVAGMDVKRAIKNTKETLRNLIRTYGIYGIRDKYGDAPLIRYALFWDLLFLKGYGKLSSTI